ncbi:hypothetical protein LOC67_07025 [Stieleria sp. JC731]|uniref:hypothetical protein n=1 Tax=Pirellulaceae TaxID=2691357 RepID=UPI001E4E7F37|nr:hypothetical protein [Stieleria sp. JC731]MCC9600309.1 hypothetical protein [Stieleria sp. JC731]
MSRLPTIRLDVSEVPGWEDQVQVVDQSGETVSLSRAGMNAIQSIQAIDQLIAPRLLENDPIRQTLQSNYWESVSDWAFTDPEEVIATEQAIAIAETGYVVVSDTLPFGPPLSSQLSTSGLLESPIEPTVSETAAPPETLDPTPSSEPNVSGQINVPFQVASTFLTSLLDEIQSDTRFRPNRNSIEGGEVDSGEQVNSKSDSVSSQRPDESVKRNGTPDSDAIPSLADGRPHPNAEQYASINSSLRQTSYQIDEALDYRSAMAWLSMDFDQRSPIASNQIRTIPVASSPFELIQLVLGAEFVEANSDGTVAFLPLSQNQIRDSDGDSPWLLRRSTNSVSFFALLIVGGYFYQRHQRQEKCETVGPQSVPLQ